MQPTKRNSAIANYVAETNSQPYSSSARFGDAPTDLDHLVSLGFDRNEVQLAMTATRGDKAAALLILKKGRVAGDESSWRGDLKDDFTSGVNTNALPNSAVNRALWKTPIYIRVGQTRTRSQKTFYVCSVVKKNGESWKVERSYSEFLKLKNSFPLFSTASFKNPFPSKNDIVSLFGSINIETRRQQLEEWMRELCLHEECMRNGTILALLGEFVEEHLHNAAGFRHATGATAANMAQSLPGGGSTSPLAPGPNARYSTATNPNVATSTSPAGPTAIPSVAAPDPLLALPLVTGPLTFHQLKDSLPFRLAVPDEQLPGRSHTDDATANIVNTDISTGSGDQSLKQLTKDYSRDRLVLQISYRLEGSHSSIAQIVGTMKDIVAQLLQAQDKQPLSTSMPSNFFVSILRKIGRTESAYITHASFARLLADRTDGELADAGIDRNDLPAAPCVIIVPESSLAEPIKISFRIKHRGESQRGEWCLQTDCEAATSFRVNDAEDTELATLLQCKLTLHKVIFGMPQLSTESGIQVVREFQERAGKSLIVVDKDMRCTARDWHTPGISNPF